MRAQQTDQPRSFCERPTPPFVGQLRWDSECGRLGYELDDFSVGVLGTGGKLTGGAPQEEVIPAGADGQLIA